MKKVLRAAPNLFYYETSFYVSLGKHWLQTAFHEVDGSKNRFKNENRVSDSSFVILGGSVSLWATGLISRNS